jgi:hypothetical protein
MVLINFQFFFNNFFLSINFTCYKLFLHISNERRYLFINILSSLYNLFGIGNLFCWVSKKTIRFLCSLSVFYLLQYFLPFLVILYGVVFQRRLKCTIMDFLYLIESFFLVIFKCYLIHFKIYIVTTC